jgi:hypothetical protein
MVAKAVRGGDKQTRDSCGKGCACHGGIVFSERSEARPNWRHACERGLLCTRPARRCASRLDRRGTAPVVARSMLRSSALALNHLIWWVAAVGG